MNTWSKTESNWKDQILEEQKLQAWLPGCKGQSTDSALKMLWARQHFRIISKCKSIITPAEKSTVIICLAEAWPLLLLVIEFCCVPKWETLGPGTQHLQQWAAKEANGYTDAANKANIAASLRLKVWVIWYLCIVYWIIYLRLYKM